MKKRNLILPLMVVGTSIPLATTIQHQTTNIKLLSSMNNNIVDYVSTEGNRISAWMEALRLHGGDYNDNCVYWVSSVLRSVGYSIPNSMCNCRDFAIWLEDHGWTNHTNLNELKPGDICFAGDTHTFIFLSWYNKEKGLANVVDDQLSYATPWDNSYIRDMKGSTGGHYLPGFGNNDSYVRTTNFMSPPKVRAYRRVVGNRPLNIRQDRDGKVIDQIPTGSEVKVFHYKDGWYLVSYKGIRGWIAGWYTTKSK